MSRRGRIKSSVRRSSVPSLMPKSQESCDLDRHRQESVAMKAKIRSLEMEVDTLKHRLDSLRKAKNTTIIKREREEIVIQPMRLGARQYSSFTERSISSQQQNHGGNQLSEKSTSSFESSSSQEKELQDIIEQQVAQLKEKEGQLMRLTEEMLQCRTAFQEEMSVLERQHQLAVSKLEERLKEKEEEIEQEKKSKESSHIHMQRLNSDEIDKLKAELELLKKKNGSLEKQLNELVDSNVQLRESNLILQGKCETLLEDLSIKEAKWSEKEDMLQAEIRKQWGDRYHQWISKAEQKMQELQQVNVMLQKMIKTKSQNPDL